MTYLASMGTDAVTSDAIASQTHVPAGYISKVLRDLVVAELVTSARGPRGGFRLARDAQEISILDVVNAVDPIRRILRCPIGNPRHTQLCALHRRLDDAMATVEAALRSTSLAEILASDQRTGGCIGPEGCNAPLTQIHVGEGM